MVISFYGIKGMLMLNQKTIKLSPLNMLESQHIFFPGSWG
jgi:hypothetical protein